MDTLQTDNGNRQPTFTQRVSTAPLPRPAVKNAPLQPYAHGAFHFPLSTTLYPLLSILYPLSTALYPRSSIFPLATVPRTVRPAGEFPEDSSANNPTNGRSRANVSTRVPGTLHFLNSQSPPSTFPIHFPHSLFPHSLFPHSPFSILNSQFLHPPFPFSNSQTNTPHPQSA
jgi:hypothetical protein